MQLYGSSTSSTSRGGRSWVRANHLSSQQYLTSDGVRPYFSSPSEISPAWRCTPPRIQEIRVDDYGISSSRAVVPLSFSPTMEGTSAVQDPRGSTSSPSDSSDYVKSHSSSHRNFSSHRCFITSKPIHPLSVPSETPPRDSTNTAVPSFSEFYGSAHHQDTRRLSSDSGSIDFTDFSEPLESDFFSRLSNSSNSFKCGLCERFLSQKSPWSSRRIVKSGDMPVAGVLSCRHVFHAECLDRTILNAQKNDPPCPLCTTLEEKKLSGQRAFFKLKNISPRRHFVEDGPPPTPCGCTHADDYIDGALHAPSRKTVASLARNRVRKNLSSKANPEKEYPGKWMKFGPCSLPQLVGRPLEIRPVGSSKSITDTSVKC